MKLQPQEEEAHLRNLYLTREEVKEELHVVEMAAKGKERPSEQLRILYAEYQFLNETIQQILTTQKHV